MYKKFEITATKTPAHSEALIIGNQCCTSLGVTPPNGGRGLLEACSLKGQRLTTITLLAQIR